jgi:hypothetical protein
MNGDFALINKKAPPALNAILSAFRLMGLFLYN